MKVINRWTAGLFTAVVITAGSLGISSIANEEEPIITTVETTQTTEPITTTQPIVKEKVTFEYYSITEEAAKNGWTCGTIDRCDKGKISVYIYDPAMIGEHKFNIFSRTDIIQLDLVVVYVDQYNEILGTETFILTENAFNRGFSHSVTSHPPGTKYVKFADLINIVYPE